MTSKIKSSRTYKMWMFLCLSNRLSELFSIYWWARGGLELTSLYFSFLQIWNQIC